MDFELDPLPSGVSRNHLLSSVLFVCSVLLGCFVVSGLTVHIMLCVSARRWSGFLLRSHRVRKFFTSSRPDQKI